MNTKKMMSLAIVAAAITLSLGSCAKYKYETVKGDPLATKIYTLDNGLKVYMSVNKETPRIQTYIAVRVGSKNDPHETTGLSHYLEHLMFKGTEICGTSDYAAEKPMLDSIKELFEVYRTKTDPAEREAIYHKIDSISYEASKIAIPNEYDKLMSVIGAEGSNAFTSTDMTVYVEDIPSNEVENWAKIEADRFRHPVIRGFHTELETVYEEKNMSLTEDFSRALESIDSVLFARHPYGLQTVLGTQEHLKNPSIINIENHRDNFYVPNNMAICLSGDFDPDTMVGIIEKYFGDWEPNSGIKMLEYEPEAPVTKPVEKVVYGPDAEFVVVSWRVPGAKDAFKSEIGDIAGSVLYNGKAGLADLDLVQGQVLNGVQAMNYTRPDYGEFILLGMPREGQSLEEVRDALLGEVAKLRSGDFGDDLVASTINNMRLDAMRSLESNGDRAMLFVDSFINGHEWKDDANRIDRLSKVSKQQVVDWCNEFLGPDSYVVAYKKVGVDKAVEKISAPKITPIETNRDKRGALLAEVQASEVAPIEPVFVDFGKDMSKGDLSGLDFLYKKNELNDISNVYYYFEEGTLSDPRYSLAFDYLDYLGTPTRSAEEIKKEMYALACDFRFSAGSAATYVSVSGLDENIGKALEVVEDLVLNAQPDEEILAGLKSDIFKSRSDNTLNQRACFSALQRYVLYGPEYIKETTIPNERLQSITSEELLSLVRGLFGKRHEILYYGPSDLAKAGKIVSGSHAIAGNPVPVEKKVMNTRLVARNEVFIAPYDANQFYYLQFANEGKPFDVAMDADVEMYNAYFGGGMNAIVFQEMREAKGLAYSASASYMSPYFKEGTYGYFAFIASQNDKLRQAVEAFDTIINDMPLSQPAFDIAKSQLLTSLRTRRLTGSSVLFEYLDLKDMGLTEDRSKVLFEKIQGMTLEDVKAFQEKNVKGRTYAYGILGDASADNFDKDFAASLGPVTYLTLEDIFQY